MVKTLDALTALAPGADLWIVTDLGRSKWTRKIDWYLNFQLTRSEPKRMPEISTELRKVMDQWDFEAPLIEVPGEAPLMVASGDLLPNSKTVLVPFQTEGEWVKKVHRIWSDFNRPSLRVFLPDSVKSGVLEKVWPAADRDATIEVVSEADL